MKSPGEWIPLPPGVYSWWQRIAGRGIERRYVPIRQQWLAWDQLPDREILEVGCGTGTMPGRGVALDLDHSRVRVVRDGGRSALTADAAKLPFSSQTFALVYCEGILHHIDDKNAVTALKEMLRVCRRGGSVFFVDNVWPRSRMRFIPYLLRRADFGKHVRTEEQLLNLVLESGAKIIKSKRVTYADIGLEAFIAVLTS